MELKRISIDTSKHVFTIHGVDGEDRVVLRRELRRGQVETFFTRDGCRRRLLSRPAREATTGAARFAPWATR